MAHVSAAADTSAAGSVPRPTRPSNSASSAAMAADSVAVATARSSPRGAASDANRNPAPAMAITDSPVST